MMPYLPAPPGSEQIAAWARARRFPYQLAPEPEWYRAWEPFWTMVAPARYFNAVQYPLPTGSVVVVEPWAAVGDEPPLGRAVMAFVSHPALAHRAAARVGGSHLTRVSFLGVTPPQQQSTGDTDWDDAALTFGVTPLDAVRAFTPSLRKLLLAWRFAGHLEIRPGGLVFHLADAQPTPPDYERVMGWVPALLEKALKTRS